MTFYYTNRHTLNEKIAVISWFLLNTLLIYLFAAPAKVIAEDAVSSTKHAFVDNNRCVECHAEQVKDWKGSHHEKAMEEANKASVLGDFNNVTFTDAGVTSRFFKKGDKYFINTEGGDGKYRDFEVKYTFGVEPLQQYLLVLPKGRLQAFTVAWDTEKKRWFDLHPDDSTPPEDPLHWSRRAFTANSSCIECHTTNMSLNFDTETAEYHTHWSEPNVSCQACHGPASQHLEWAKHYKESKNESSEHGESNRGLLVNYKGMDSKQVVESCARCHSRRYAVSENNAHGRSYFDDYMPELLRPGSYHADGQIQDEVYVYGSFVQSKMYHKGVSCADCHNPHTLKLRHEGNAMCMSCHQVNPPKARFATLQAKAYDSPRHHFHQAGSAGAQCVNCHMPSTTYMQNDPRRDHSFSIPRPDLTEKWKTPNACNRCHEDKTTDWATQAMDKWYGKAWRERPSTAKVMTQARQALPEALKPLMALINDTETAAIVRATAMDLLPAYGASSLTAVEGGLQDASPLVRVAAVQGLEPFMNKRLFKVITPLLYDPIRAVRIEVARLLATVPQDQFSEQDWRQEQKTLKEYQAAQLAMADHPEGHINLGNLHMRMGDKEKALAAYQTAVRMDERFTPAYSSLGQFYYATGKPREALAAFRSALQSTPEAGDIHYSMALLLSELKQPEEALTHMERAAQLLPDLAQIHFNHGLLLQKQNKMTEAENALLKARSLASADRRIIQALLALYRQQGNTEKMKALAEQLNQQPTTGKNQ